MVDRNANRNDHDKSRFKSFKQLIWKEAYLGPFRIPFSIMMIISGDICSGTDCYSEMEFSPSGPLSERWGAGVETQKNVRGEILGWGRIPFNEPYAPSLSTLRPVVKYHLRRGVGLMKFLENGTRPQPPTSPLSTQSKFSISKCKLLQSINAASKSAALLSNAI